jgi:hypothetical protein
MCVLTFKNYFVFVVEGLVTCAKTANRGDYSGKNEKKTIHQAEHP